MATVLQLATSQEQQGTAHSDDSSNSSTPDRIIPIWECILKWRQLNSDVTTTTSTTSTTAANAA
jgi:hypothetical protein